MKKINKVLFVTLALVLVVSLWAATDSHAFIGRVVSVPQIHQMLIASDCCLYMVVLNEVCPWTDFDLICYSPDNYGHGKWWIEKWIKGKNVRVNVTKKLAPIEKIINGKKMKIPVIEANIYLHSGCNTEEWSMAYYKRGLSVNKNILRNAKKHGECCNDKCCQTLGYGTWDY